MQKHLIISVHGILTAVSWQSTLRRAILEIEPSAVVHDFDYKTVSPYSLVRGRRGSQAKKFGDALLSEMTREPWDRIDIVAHSFGTYVAAEGLRYLVRNVGLNSLPRIHTFILCGSVLQATYPLRELVPTLVGRVVNDCGLEDQALWGPELFLPGLGFAGRVGFEGLSGHDVINRRFLFGHSGYFRETGSSAITSNFMKKWWIPLLTQDLAAVPEHDDRSKRRWPVLISLLERQVNLIRIGIAALATCAAAFGIVTYDRHEAGILKAHNQALTAQNWTLEALQRRNTAPVEAARLAIASAAVHRTAHTDQALLALLQTSARPKAQLSAWGAGGGFLVDIDAAGDLVAEARGNDAGDTLLHLKSMPGVRPSRDDEISTAGCGPKRQPERLRFSPSGAHLVLETFFGSCVLDVRTGTWQSSHPSYGHIVFTEDEHGWFASRLPIAASSASQELSSLVTYSDAKGTAGVSGIVGAGWIDGMARLGSFGAIFADSMGRVWLAASSSMAERLLLPALESRRAIQVSASVDGHRLAIGTESSTLLLVDAVTHALKWQVALKVPPTKIVFSRDGTRLAVLLNDGTASVISAADGTVVGSFDGEGFPLDTSFLDDTGSQLLMINRDAYPKVWDVGTQSLLVRVPVAVFDDRYGFDSAGHAIATAADDGTTTVWDAGWRSEARPLNLDEGIDRVQVGGNGQFVTLLGRHGRVRLWDARHEQVLLDIPSAPGSDSAWRSALALSEHGDVVALVDDSATLRAWRPGRGEVFRLSLPRYFAEVSNSKAQTLERLLPASTDPRLLSGCSGVVQASLAASGVEIASAWLNRECRPYRDSELPQGLVSADLWNMRPALALSTDGRLLAVAVLGDLFVFDIDSGRVVHRWALGYEDRSNAPAPRGEAFGPPIASWLAFSADGTSVLACTKKNVWTGSDGNVVTSWPLSDAVGHPTRERLDKDDVVLGAIFGTQLVASVSRARDNILFLDASTLAPVRRLRASGQVDAVYSSFWHPNTIVVASHQMHRHSGQAISGEQVNIYDRHSLTLKRQVMLRVPAVWISLMPDEERLMAMDSQGNVTILDVASGEPTAYLPLAAKPQSAWFAGDGTFFYTKGTNRDYLEPLAGAGTILSLQPRKTDELTRLLCQTLRPTDKDFSALAREVDKPIACGT